MSEQILAVLNKTLEGLDIYRNLDAETKRNALKEELQYYVLDFIYHHKDYSKWIMYGGSALRIIHGLNRMSVDLDFEVPHVVTPGFLNNLKIDIENHFIKSYGATEGFIVVKIVGTRGLLIKFNVGEQLSLNHSSKQVHLKLDLNHFIAPNTVTERRPINHNQFSFVIITYNMSALMASKLVAIFNRPQRGVGEFVFEEKGRDIYDLIWYMEKRIIPDLDYLKAKNVDVTDQRALFNKLTFKLQGVTQDNLKQDLLPLFSEKPYIENWLENWFEIYFRLYDNYKIRKIISLNRIDIHQHFSTDNYSFTYIYNTEEGVPMQIRYILSDYWILFREGDLSITPIKEVTDKITFSRDGTSSEALKGTKLKKYATLFYEKNTRYFKKNNQITLGDGIITKVIIMSANNLNREEQIVLNKSALLDCELEDLLK